MIPHNSRPHEYTFLDAHPLWIPLRFEMTLACPLPSDPIELILRDVLYQGLHPDYLRYYAPPRQAPPNGAAPTPVQAAQMRVAEMRARHMLDALIWRVRSLVAARLPIAHDSDGWAMWVRLADQAFCVVGTHHATIARSFFVKLAGLYAPVEGVPSALPRDNMVLWLALNVLLCDPVLAALADDGIDRIIAPLLDLADPSQTGFPLRDEAAASIVRLCFDVDLLFAFVYFFLC